MSAQDVGDQDVEETARRFKDPATYNGEPVCVCCGDGWPNCVDRRPDGSRYSHLDTCYRYKWADLCDRCERECAEETQAPGVDLGREGLAMSLPNDKPAPTLSEFLIARLAEVAQAAAHAKWAMQGLWYEDADDRVDEFVRMMSPDRVLVDVDAKLQIIALHTEGGGGWDPSCVDEDEPVCLGEIRKCRTLHALALPYAGHPDYRQEWKL